VLHLVHHRVGPGFQDAKEEHAECTRRHGPEDDRQVHRDDPGIGREHERADVGRALPIHLDVIPVRIQVIGKKRRSADHDIPVQPGVTKFTGKQEDRIDEVEEAEMKGEEHRRLDFRARRGE